MSLIERDSEAGSFDDNSESDGGRGRAYPNPTKPWSLRKCREHVKDWNLAADTGVRICRITIGGCVCKFLTELIFVVFASLLLPLFVFFFLV